MAAAVSIMSSVVVMVVIVSRPQWRAELLHAYANTVD